MSKVIKGGGGSYPSANPGYPQGGRSGGGFQRSGQPRVQKYTAEDVNARSEAQSIIQHATEEAALIRSQAEAYRQQGYEEGYRAGIEQGKSEWMENVLRLNRENEAKFRFFEHDLVRLSVRVAEKIIGEQLRLEPKSITELVGNALTAVRHQREIFLRVNPDDYDLINEHKYLLLDKLSRAQDIDIRPDPGVPPGGCLIESETGTIEATVEKQLEAIEKILLGET
ncbi:MAG: hypothetical protein EP343_32425 [Deltaproteobacteria bacterium]|nr:MAG: hypothetical protein EP343_32425 [Deltaproteobacteria bacterium]